MSLAPSTPLLNLVLSLGLTLWLLLTLLVLNRITWHWVVRPLSGVLFSDRRRTIWYHLTLFPGTVIHECSHLLACWLLLVPVLEFQPFSLDSNRSPGWVRHQRTDPFRAAMIGLAPFLGGSIALLLLSHFAFPTFYAADWFQGLQAPAPDNLLFLGGHLIRLVWDLLRQANYLDSVDGKSCSKRVCDPRFSAVADRRGATGTGRPGSFCTWSCPSDYRQPPVPRTCRLCPAGCSSSLPCSVDATCWVWV